MMTMVPYAHLFDLTGKRALVIGSGGIGLEVAKALAAHHAAVTVADNVAETLRAASAAVGADAVQLDITDAPAVQACAASYPVDIVISTVGMNVRKRLADYSDDEFGRVVDVNLRGTFHLIRAFGPAMASREGGSFTAFSSIRASVVEPGQGVYAATKAGLQQLVRAAAAEFGPAGVRFNSIAPGVVETPLTAQIRADAAWERAYATKSALGRWARPDEIVGAAVYLASDASSYVTGSVLTVDGGWTAVDGRFDPFGGVV
jgi:NAD(P)-dependent dehydrogenase (short-subunit alcohol dehydrogenase family)